MGYIERVEKGYPVEYLPEKSRDLPLLGYLVPVEHHLQFTAGSPSLTRTIKLVVRGGCNQLERKIPRLVLTVPERGPSPCWSRRPGAGTRVVDSGPRRPAPLPRGGPRPSAPGPCASSAKISPPTGGRSTSLCISGPSRICPCNDEKIKYSLQIERSEHDLTIISKFFHFTFKNKNQL